VAAILAGDEQKLAQQLETQGFSNEAAWPEVVKYGVELMGWMVAHGHLDIRVALRIHAHTGKPLPFESIEDGYVDGDCPHRSLASSAGGGPMDHRTVARKPDAL
jgi:hypothetical protein